MVSFSYAESGTNESDFQKNFNIAKQHLSHKRILQALPYLEYLKESHNSNSNLDYLIGVCYVEAQIVNPLATDLLLSASEKVSLEYDPNSLEEERSPIYVFYYLSVAYAQQHRCDEAEFARKKFLEIYPHEDKFYIEESEKWIKQCYKSKSEVAIVELPEFPDFVPYTSTPKKTNSIEKLDFLIEEVEKEEKQIKTPIYDEVEESKEIVTKNVEYSTNQPLYGVQLGAFKEVVPVYRFRPIKNVDAFLDHDGLIRYVVGHFSIHSQAMSLLKALQKKGYNDAFIVNVNDKMKFKEEVVSVNNINIRAGLNLEIEYCVQLGAFKEQMPDQLAGMYIDLDDVKVLEGDIYTYLTSGQFSSYTEAKKHQEKLKRLGINDAFVVAVNRGKKISLQHAFELNP